MKNHKVAWAVTILLVVAAIALGQFKAPVRQSDSFYVTDKANLFSASEESAILDACQRLQHTAGSRMIVVTVKHTGLQGMESYTEDLWDDWKLSSVDMLLVMTDDDYYFLYGSELWETMDYAYRDLLDRYLEPEFAVRQYGDAVLAFISGAEIVLLGEDDIGYPDDGYGYSSNGSGVLLGFLIFALIVVVVLVFSKSRPASKRSYYGGYATPRPVSRPIIIHTSSHRPSVGGSFRSASRPASRPSSFGGGGRRSGGSFGGGGGRGGGSRGGGGRR